MDSDMVVGLIALIIGNYIGAALLVDNFQDRHDNMKYFALIPGVGFVYMSGMWVIMATFWIWVPVIGAAEMVYNSFKN